MRQAIEAAVADAIRAAEFLKKPSSLEFIETASAWIAGCFEAQGKILIAGNGGSLCDAMHFAEELTGVFRGKRRALPAIALSDPGHLTCVANDIGFEDVFSRAVEALGRPEDILILMTTSGNSQNIINAARCAKEKGIRTIAFLGKSGRENPRRNATWSGSFPDLIIPIGFRRRTWQLSISLSKWSRKSSFLPSASKRPPARQISKLLVLSLLRSVRANSSSMIKSRSKSG